MSPLLCQGDRELVFLFMEVGRLQSFWKERCGQAKVQGFQSHGFALQEQPAVK